MNKPSNLRVWFLIHFVGDVLIAIPLFFFPTISLSYLNWKTIDPIAARVVAAALFGIGIESFLSRNAKEESFKHLLNLKIIWSLFASLGIIISLCQNLFGNILVGAVILFVFLFFNLVWLYYRLKI